MTRKARIVLSAAAAAVLLAAGLSLTGCDRLDSLTGSRAAYKAAARATGGDPHAGREKIRRYGCQACHTIPGIPGANAVVGPPLTGIANRSFLAGRLQNTPGNMERWILDPKSVDPQTAMPNVGVTPADARAITAFLYTLR